MSVYNLDIGLVDRITVSQIIDSSVTKLDADRRPHLPMKVLRPINQLGSAGREIRKRSFIIPNRINTAYVIAEKMVSKNESTATQLRTLTHGLPTKES